MNNENYMARATAELYKIFEALNIKYFDGELETPIITIQQSGKRLAYGWFTVGKVWRDKTGEKRKHEINISAEYLNREIKNIVATLQHELVHYYNIVNNIKDCSRGNTYHNTKFKEEAEKRGLSISYDSRIGWSITEPKEEFIKFINEEIRPDIESFSYFRAGEFIINTKGKDNDGENKGTGDDGETKKKKTSVRRYVCPECGMIVRATKIVNVICGDCNKKLVCDEDKDDEDKEEKVIVA
jgi:predicted RNA-binding Zn-ribbon protein involved in translation (DUF1610 family)